MFIYRGGASRRRRGETRTYHQHSRHLHSGQHWLLHCCLQCFWWTDVGICNPHTLSPPYLVWIFPWLLYLPFISSLDFDGADSALLNTHTHCQHDGVGMPTMLASVFEWTATGHDKYPAGLLRTARVSYKQTPRLLFELVCWWVRLLKATLRPSMLTRDCIIQWLITVQYLTCQQWHAHALKRT